MLSPNDHQVLKEATVTAERRTSGEIYTVVAQASDDYRYIPILIAAAIALPAPLPFFYLTDWAADMIWICQMAIFIVLALPTYFPAVRTRLVPGPVRRQRVYRRALEQFLAHNIHTTSGRTGVLIYVSLAERRVELIADTGIDAKIDQSEWQAIVDRLTAAVKRGDLSSGLGQAIERCGALLAEHFPAERADTNELSDHIVEI